MRVTLFSAASAFLFLSFSVKFLVGAEGARFPKSPNQLNHFERRQDNSSAFGKVCVQDDYLESLERVPENAIPFCSSFISIPLVTVTASDAVARETVTMTTTDSTPIGALATIPSSTVTATVFSTIYFGGFKKRDAAPLPTPKANVKDALANFHEWKRQAVSCNDTSILVSLSSGCSCLHITPSTTTVSQTTTTIRTLTAILYQGFTSSSALITGITTVTVTDTVYKSTVPLSTAPSTTSLTPSLAFPSSTAPVTSPAASVETLTLPSTSSGSGTVSIITGTNFTSTVTIPGQNFTFTNTVTVTLPSSSSNVTVPSTGIPTSSDSIGLSSVSRSVLLETPTGSVPVPSGNTTAPPAGPSITPSPSVNNSYTGSFSGPSSAPRSRWTTVTVSGSILSSFPYYLTVATSTYYQTDVITTVNSQVSTFTFPAVFPEGTEGTLSYSILPPEVTSVVGSVTSQMPALPTVSTPTLGRRVPRVRRQEPEPKE